MKHDAHVFHLEAFGQLRAQSIEIVDVHIKHFARRGIERVVVVINVRVEPQCTAVAAHELDFAHLREFVERLIHRAQRDAGHSLARHRKQCIGGRVGGVVVQQRKDQLSLRREATTLRAIFGGNDFGGLHAEHAIRLLCLFANRADKGGLVSRHTAALLPCTKVN